MVATQVLERHIKITGEGFREVEGQLSKFIVQYNKQGQAVGVLETQLQKLSKTQQVISKQQLNLGQISGLSPELAKSIEKNTSGFKGLEIGAQNFMTRLNTLRWAMVNFIFVTTAVAALAAPFILLTKYGIELEALFTKISVVTGSSIDSIKAQILDLRKGTQFSVQETSEAFLEFSKQGFSASESLKALPAIQRLSIVGFTDMTTATKMVAQVMHTYNMEASQAAHITDILTAAANASAADVGDFGTSLSYATGIGNQAGISFEELSATLAVLSNKGLGAARAGTSLTAFIQALISPSEEAKVMLEGLGIATTDAEGRFIGLNNVLHQFAAAARVGDIKKVTEALNTILGTRGTRVGAAIIKDINEGVDSIGLMEEEINKVGYAQEKAAQISGTALARFKSFWNDIKAGFADAGIGIAKGLGGALEVLDSIGEYRTVEIDYTQAIPSEEEMQKLKDTAIYLALIANQGKIGIEYKPELAPEDMAKIGVQVRKSVTSPMTDIVRNPYLEQAARDIGKLPTTPLTKEQEEAKKAKEEFDRLSTALETAKTKMEGILEVDTGVAKQFQSIIDKVKNLQSVSPLVPESFFSGVIKNLEEGKQKALNLAEAIAEDEEKSREWQTTLRSLQGQLKSNQSALDDYQEALRKVNERIAVLSRPRFTGQLETEKLINAAELWLKKQRLAAMGITDAQAFIQSALDKTRGGYDDIFNSIQKVQEEANKGKTSYEVWEETIEKFIETTLKVSNDLGKNVSRTIGQFSTLLLATSKYGDEFNQQEAQVNALRDAYDVTYGSMTDDVRFAIQAHEEQVNGVFASSGLIIAALQDQWVAQTNWNSTITDSQSRIKELRSELDAAQGNFDALREKIEESTRAMSKLVEETLKLIKAQKGEGGGALPAGTYVGSAIGTDFSKPNPVTGYPYAQSAKDYVGKSSTHTINERGQIVDDFIMRPGQTPISFSSDDTVMGFKGKGPVGQTITIGDINVYGVSGDPEEIANAIAKTLRREMRTG